MNSYLARNPSCTYFQSLKPEFLSFFSIFFYYGLILYLTIFIYVCIKQKVALTLRNTSNLYHYHILNLHYIHKQFYIKAQNDIKDPYCFHPFTLSSPTPKRPSFSTLVSVALGKNLYLFSNTLTKYRFRKYSSIH